MGIQHIIVGMAGEQLAKIGDSLVESDIDRRVVYPNPGDALDLTLRERVGIELQTFAHKLLVIEVGENPNGR